MRWMFGLDDLDVFDVLYVLDDLDVLDVLDVLDAQVLVHLPDRGARRTTCPSWREARVA